MHARLLWVDDEIEMLKAHILFLQKKDYEVVTASNGPDALDLCREQRFDLILLDENMPGLSGLETLMHLKDIAPHVPVVMVTKNEEEDIMDQAIGSKIADYLIKPVNPNQILLALKKNIHQREIVQEVAQTGYRQDFSRIGMQLSENLTADEWKELYKRLVYWELELSEADSAMNDMLRMQKEEANLTFAKFVRKHYEEWIAHPDARPLMSPDIFKRCIFPRLSQGRKVFLLVLDNFRFDQWRVLASELADDFDMDEDLYYSILPTATQYARNALFAGLMPLQIKEMYPQLWVDEEEDEGKNLNEEQLIRSQLDRFRRKEAFTYHKINDSSQVDKVLPQITSGTVPLSVLVVNFIDILSHARTESKMVRELAGNESAYRSITLSTSGIVPRIYALAEEGIPISLSISLHAPEDALRSRLMPINRKYPLAEVVAAGKAYGDKTKRRVTYEYILIDGVNDSLEQARLLARLLRGQLASVNLIPINPVVERHLLRPSQQRVEAFEQCLDAHHIAVTVRREMGADINAACGQLRAKFAKEQEKK